MNAAELLVRVAVSVLPSAQRHRYREEWLADLRDAPGQGLSRASVLRGVARFTASSLPRSLGSELHAAFGRRQLVIVLVLLAIYLYVMFPADGLFAGQQVVLRDHLDLFAEFLNTPFALLVPLLAVFLGQGRYPGALSRRQAQGDPPSQRTAGSAVRALVVSVTIAFMVFTTWVFVAFLLAFVLWPSIGDPSVLPSAYGLNDGSALVDSYGRTTFSQLLRFGPWTFGVFYSIWFGVCAATYAAVGAAALQVIRRRPLALAVPLMIFVTQSVLAEAAGVPSLGLNVSMLPFGRQQQSIIVGVTPTLALALIAAVSWVLLLQQQRRTTRS